MECPKCEREIKEDEKICPYCDYDLVNRSKVEKRESTLFIKLKEIMQKEFFIIESVLAIALIIMFIAILGANSRKESLEKEYNDFQVKAEDTSKNLQEEIKQKDNKITSSEKKITELQQEEKKKEINEGIKTLESEKQKLEEEKKALEQEKQTLTTQIEELKKTSSALSEKKSQYTASTTSKTAKTATQNTNSSIVYVTKTGKKYHKSGCSYLKKSKIEMTLSNATSSGYTPCSRCY